MLKHTNEIKENFDTMTYKWMFKGYGTDSSAYRVYVVECDTMEESTIVTFDET